jgi:RNA polymerase sigma factor (sigma-70 family)
MDTSTHDLPSVVQAAQTGDATAWTELVERFQDFAVAVALGHGSDWDAARDVAQEAFLLAVVKLDSLRDPAAFPGWFAALVRTACGRRARQPVTAVEGVGPVVDVATTDPEPLDVVIAADQALRVRQAVEALPEHERTVVALHFLADLEFAEIARFLNIGESAARKRAHSARQRLKEMDTMAMQSLSDARPSRSHEFGDELLLFMAIDRGDAAAVSTILTRSPGLTEVPEVWSWSEALAAGLGVARRGTPLVRAVEAGSRTVVEALLDAGAAVDGRCACVGAETPLWTAVVTGQQELADRLLQAGADPNAPSFNASTPMHAAGQRHPELLALLAEAGGDLERRDGGGRTPAEWAELTRARGAAGPGGGERVETGIRTVDLFAPLARGSRQFWPAAVGVGQLVLPFGIADALDGVELWWVGFEHGGHYANGALAAESRELDVPATARLAGGRLGLAAASARFGEALEELAAAPADKLVVIIDAAEHHHEVMLAVHALSADPCVVSTIVIAPLDRAAALDADGRVAERLTAVPEGFDTLVCFDAALAAAGRFPAVDPLASRTRLALAERQAELASTARALLRGGDTERAEALRDELKQRLRLGEPFGSIPGELTPLADTLTRVERLLGTG